jgi:maleate isomerase
VTAPRFPDRISLGRRARIGLLYPETGLLDEEFWAFAPDGVALYIARTRVEGNASRGVLTSMAESPEVERLARGFAKIDVDAVAYACTAAGFVRGPGLDAELTERLSAAAAAPATCTITASVEAMRHLGLQRISVVTPYIGELDERLNAFLCASGFEVLEQRSLGLRGKDINLVPLEPIYDLACAVHRPEADGIYIACTGFRSLEIIEPLEVALGKPVVSANQATIWHALRLAGIRATGSGLGRLYALGEELAHV